MVGSSPVDIQALQQNLGDGEILCCSVAQDIQAFSEFSHRLLPLSFSEEGVALIEEVAYQLGQEVLGGGRKMRVRCCLCIPKSVILICPVQHNPVIFLFVCSKNYFFNICIQTVEMGKDSKYNDFKQTMTPTSGRGWRKGELRSVKVFFIFFFALTKANNTFSE